MICCTGTRTLNLDDFCQLPCMIRMANRVVGVLLAFKLEVQVFRFAKLFLAS